MRTLIVFLLSLSIALPTAVFAYDDVDSKAVERLIEANILPDGNKFLPAIPCTRGQFVTWALKNIEEDVTGKTIREPFIDVSPANDFAPYVGRAWQLGVISSSIRFRPAEAVTRIEALKIALKLEGVTIPRGGFEVKGFLDLPRDAEARGTINKALELGIIKPVNDKLFGTSVAMNRLECAQLLDAVALSRLSEQYINIKIGEKVKRAIPMQDTLGEVMHDLQTKYLHADKIDTNALMETGIKDMVNSLDDPHTVFFTGQEVKNFLTSVGVETQYGIGAQVGLDKDKRAMIVNPLRNSPAEKAGLLPGDVIMKVDGKDVSTGELPLEVITGLIKGEDGTLVRIEFLRNEKIQSIEITRGPIRIESVFPSVKDGYLILVVDYFGNDTVDKIRAAITDNMSAAKKGIILDLRDDPGGFLDAAVDLLAQFLPKGSVAVKTRGADFTHTEKVSGPGDLLEIPIVVLVNERSASASEIVAGAMQDNKRAVIIGKKTFGKGTAQELVQFKDGTALKLTIAEWLTPNDRNIDGIGITPDYVSDLTEDEAIWDYAIRIIQRGQWKPV